MFGSPFWSNQVSWETADREEHLSPQSSGKVPESAGTLVTLRDGDRVNSCILSMTNIPEDLRGLGE